MPLDLTTLLKAGTRAATGYQQGRLEGDERERRARMDLIQEQILNARLAELTESAAERRRQREAAEQGQELAGLEANRAEALQYERAGDYAQRFPGQVPQGLHPSIAIERGQAAEKAATARVPNIDPNSPEGIAARLQFERGRPRQPTATDTRAQDVAREREAARLVATWRAAGMTPAQVKEVLLSSPRFANLRPGAVDDLLEGGQGGTGSPIARAAARLGIDLPTGGTEALAEGASPIPEPEQGMSPADYYELLRDAGLDHQTAERTVRERLGG